MKLLMIGHLLGDFYFQTNSMSEKKKESFRHTALHCLIYSVVMYIVLSMATGQPDRFFFPILLIGILHLVVDGIKCIVYKACNIKKMGAGSVHN